MASVINKDIVLVISLVLSVVSLVLLLGVTWYFQSSLDLLQQEVAGVYMTGNCCSSYKNKSM